MEPQPRELRQYVLRTGKAPFFEWLLGLRDRDARHNIIIRLKRMSYGHFGDCRFVGHGVLELRVHVGPGYRVYFGEDEGLLILLLCGGDKSTQNKDIRKAQQYWADYRGRQ